MPLSRAARIEQARLILDQLYDDLLEISNPANQHLTMSLDGASAPWTGYREMLMKQIANLEEHIAMLDPGYHVSIGK